MDNTRKPAASADEHNEDGSKPGSSPTNPVNMPAAKGNPGNLDDSPQQSPSYEASMEAAEAKAKEERARNRMPEQKIDPLTDNPEYVKAVHEQKVGAGPAAQPARDARHPDNHHDARRP